MLASAGYFGSNSHWPAGTARAIEVWPMSASLARQGTLRSEASRRATVGRIGIGAPCPDARSRPVCRREAAGRTATRSLFAQEWGSSAAYWALGLEQDRF